MKSHQSLVEDPAFGEVKRLILDLSGLYYYSDKDADLAGRIGARMSVRKIASCGAYLLLLEGDANERDELIAELTVGETYFFRQHEHFELLRGQVIPELLERNSASRTLRIWSAGCANGSEPYSVAILLRLHFADLLDGWDVSILGTDIDAHVLKSASTAVFGSWALREVPETIRTRCFEKSGVKWQLRPEFRKRVRFERHNLVASEPYPGRHEPFDVILCRNVLIYFSETTIREVTCRLADSLADHGWLLVGHAEPNANNFERFAPAGDGSAMAYRKAQFTTPAPLVASTPLPPPPLTRARTAPPRRPPASPPRPATASPVAVTESEALLRARELADRGETDEAERLLRAAVQQQPLSASAHYTLGLILEQRSCDEAREAFRRAIYLDRTHAMAHFQLGVCMERDRRYDEARKSYDNVISLLEYGSPDAPLRDGGGIAGGEILQLARTNLDRLARR